MPDSIIQPSPGNTEAALVRLEGKIDRLLDQLTRHAEDVKTVRERLHDHANHLSALTALNPAEKIDAIHDRLTDHDQRIKTVETDMQQRRGAMTVIRALWVLSGAVAAAIVGLIVKVIGGAA